MRSFFLLVTVFLFSGCFNAEVKPCIKEVKEVCPKLNVCAPCAVCPKQIEPEVCKTCAPCKVCPKQIKPEKCKPITIYKDYKKLVLGEVEEAFFPAYELSLEARIDSGAQTSSMHAQNIVAFERDGKKWVRFTVLDTNENKVELKKPIVKSIKVKRHGKNAQERFVVHMRVNISKLSQYIEVSLNNREEYNYPVLIGRNFLRGNAIVDVSLKHTESAIRTVK